jgi:hypothetical protein
MKKSIIDYTVDYINHAIDRHFRYHPLSVFGRDWRTVSSSCGGVCHTVALWLAVLLDID